jgi:hypothetical protein
LLISLDLTQTLPNAGSYSRDPPDDRRRSGSLTGRRHRQQFRMPVVLQPRHRLAQPRSRSAARLVFLLSKLDRLRFCFGDLLRIVKLGRQINTPQPAIRAQHGKLSRQTYRAQHGYFARTRWTAHATVGLGNFSGSCHKSLLSDLRGLLGSSLHYFYEPSQFIVDLPKPVGGKLRRISDTFACARHLLVPDVRREGAGE